ncbi:AAA family ATPase [Methylobacterium sp. WL12]|uniref:AAA family ATPase n=1 Tax=Methylobacterium sp. WL12 TaxID=2603890 RepID=UPI0011CA64B1|nr:AAA family ATPase [Methylobacterium sp. WL12]TXM72889.1 AAA family ATPase [Methylobacterium sp. WL12]
MADLTGYTIEHGKPDHLADEALSEGYDGWANDRVPIAPRRGAGKGSAKPLIFTAAELRRREFSPIRYVVPGYIAEGCTLLAGRPKLGKSWLVLEAGLAVASGSNCLGGIPCEQGDVLYLALEDNERRLQRRMDKVLGAFATEWPAAFECATEWPRSNEGGIDAIEEWILSKENPRLVIVDVLAMFKPVRGDKESLYEADYLSIKGLQGLAGKYQVAIVVVHHTRKSGTESDPFEKVSGTLGLSGAADTTVILDRDGNGATLYGRGRDVEEIEAAVIFDKASCRWHVQGEASEVRRTDERGGILAALEDADEPMSPGEIAIATGHTRNAIDQLLYKMGKAGEVLKAGRGRYVHPNRTDLIDRDAGTPHKNDKKIRKAPSAEGDTERGSPPDLTGTSAPVRNAPLDPTDEAAVEDALRSIHEAKEAGAPEWPALLAALVNMTSKDEVARLAKKLGLDLGGDDA